ncbi:hypothetical protein MKZ17_03760 [Solibacillus sp. FSL R7-0682]|uniref:hypothetical protein n=1 Tax=Solibacillus sp. FSL R7-0682 TaxID=2921690 RepID=UPI0030F71575
MRFALVSIVKIYDVDFTSMILYESDEQGIWNCIAEIAKPFEIDDMLDDLAEYKVSEIQTDSQTIYRELVSAKIPVIYRKEVTDTRELIGRSEEMLIELFELNLEPAVVLPRWRLFIITKLEKLIQILKTRGLKHNDN